MYRQTHRKFIVNRDPRSLIANSRAENHWVKHEVALLLVSQPVTQVAMVLPKRAAIRDADHVRIPPQTDLGVDQTYLCAARDIARKLIRQPIRTDQFQFIGSAYGNHRRGGHLEPYGKLVHWAAVHLSQTDGVALEATRQFQEAYWWHIMEIMATRHEVMSERKCQMMMEALSVLNGHGVDGQLTRQAKALAAV